MNARIDNIDAFIETNMIKNDYSSVKGQVIDEDTGKTDILYTTSQALVCVQELTTTAITLKVVIDRNNYYRKKAYNKYAEYKKIEFLTSEDKHLVVKVQNLNTDLELQQEGIERKELLVKYIDFIKANNGNKPSIFSENDKERQLAEQYQRVKEKLSSSELKLIENTIIEASQTAIEESFFDLFHSFINHSGANLLSTKQ